MFNDFSPKNRPTNWPKTAGQTTAGPPGTDGATDKKSLFYIILLHRWWLELGLLYFVVVGVVAPLGYVRAQECRRRQEIAQKMPKTW